MEENKVILIIIKNGPGSDHVRMIPLSCDGRSVIIIKKKIGMSFFRNNHFFIKSSDFNIERGN